MALSRGVFSGGFVGMGPISDDFGWQNDQQPEDQWPPEPPQPEEQPQDIYGPPQPDYGDWSSDNPNGAYGNYMANTPVQRWAGAGLPATNIETAPYMPFSPEAQFALEQYGRGNTDLSDLRGGQLGNLVPGVIPDSSEGPSMWGQTAANALNDVGAPQWSQDLGRSVADFLPFAVTGGFSSLPGLAAAGAGQYGGTEAGHALGVPDLPVVGNPLGLAGMIAAPGAPSLAEGGFNLARGVGRELGDRWPQPVYRAPRSLEELESIRNGSLWQGSAVTRDQGLAQDFANRWSQQSGEDLPVMEFRASNKDLTPEGYYQTTNRPLRLASGESGEGPNPLGWIWRGGKWNLEEVPPSIEPVPMPETPPQAFAGKGTRGELRAALEAAGVDTTKMKPGQLQAAWERLHAQPEPNPAFLDEMGHPPLAEDAVAPTPPTEEVPTRRPSFTGYQPPEPSLEPPSVGGGAGMGPPVEPPAPPSGEPPPGDAQEWLRTNRERARNNAVRGATSPEPPKSIKELTNVAEESRYNKGLGVGGEAEPPAPSPLKRAFDELMSLPGMAQTVMAGGDVSAISRQEAVLGAGNPARWKEAAAATLKAFGSPEAANAANEAVHQGKWYDFQKTAGVHEYEFGPGVNPAERVPGYTGISDSWLGRQVTKEWRIGGQQIPNPLLAGERSFATGLNVEGFGVGEDYLQKMWDIAHTNPKGFNDAVFERDARALAKVINHGRGYGTGRVADVISATHAFFSGRKFVANFQIVFDPFFQPGSLFEPSARQLAAKNLIGFASANAGVMGFLGLTGAAAGGLWSVNPDPLAGDFGKLRIGNMRIDTMGGVEPLIRLVAREGVAIRQGDWAKVTPELTRFFANKGSPAVSVLRDAMVAADPGLRRYLGSSDSFSGKAFALRFAPLMLQDMREAYQQQGGGLLGFGSAALAGASDFVGLGVNTYQDKADQSQSVFDPRFTNPGPSRPKAHGVPVGVGSGPVKPHGVPR